jgi:hypothetical protein
LTEPTLNGVRDPVSEFGAAGLTAISGPDISFDIEPNSGTSGADGGGENCGVGRSIWISG